MEKEFDLYNKQVLFDRLKETISNEKESQQKEILLKFLAWHELQIQKGGLQTSSVLRSLQTIYELISFPGILDEKPYSIEAVKNWWKYNLNRGKRLGSTKHGGLKVETLNGLSRNGLERIQSQTSKSLKFLEFLQEESDITFFSPKKQPPAKGNKYLILPIESSKTKESLRVDEIQFKNTVDLLFKSKGFYQRQAAVMAILIYDCGLRMTEAASLTQNSLKVIPEGILITLNHSKTATRTVISYLSKPYLEAWQMNSPNKDNPEKLLFSSGEGNKLDYTKLSLAFKYGMKKTGLSLPKGHVWHALRHDFASRAHGWPEHLLNYYCGWQSRTMRSHYSEYNYKACIPFLEAMNKDSVFLKPLSVLEAEARKLKEEDKALENLVKLMSREPEFKSLMERVLLRL